MRFLNKKFNVIDLFGAPGGLALGFQMTGYFKILACVDNDRIATLTYAHNFPEAKVICEDIKKVNGRELLEIIGISQDDVDIVIGGPPCPGFSVVGRVKIASLQGNPCSRFVTDPRNMLYKDFIRIVKELMPKYIVIENVFGMRSYRNGEVIHQILKHLASLGGYNTDWKILNAAQYGVPQQRKRIFFIGNRLGLPNLFPAVTHGSHIKKNPGKKKMKKIVTVWDAIGDLPQLQAGEGEEIATYNRKPRSDYQKWARKKSKWVYNHVARRHSRRDIKLFSMMCEGARWKDLPHKLKRMYGYRDDIFSDKMKRLQRNKPSWTITAHIAKDGYMYIHPTQNRTITVREAARLQSFPDNFRFIGSRTDQFKQVGNAVPPLLGKAVAETIGKLLRKYK